MKKNFLILICIAIISFGFIYSTQATPILTISDGTEFLTITDNDGFLDESDISGVVEYSGSVGIFVLNIITGTTHPIMGSLSVPQMYLESVNVSSLSDEETGTLTISFYEDGFGTPDTVLTGFQTDITHGLTQGTVSFSTYLNSTVISSFLGSGGLFNDSTTYLGSPDNTFSLTAYATITHGSGMNTSSFDMHISSIADVGGTSGVLPVPEPSTLFLLGSGLVGIGFYSSRKK